MKTIIAVALMLVGTAPAKADDFDRHRTTDRANLDVALGNMAKFCSSELGFTQLPRGIEAKMPDKLQAYFLLSSDPDYTLVQWGKMLEKFNQIATSPNDKALINRSADALIAAVKDPTVTARAEEQYVEIYMTPVRAALDGCEYGAKDEFIGTHYWTGTGSTEEWVEAAKSSFTENLKDLQSDK